MTTPDLLAAALDAATYAADRAEASLLADLERVKARIALLEQTNRNLVAALRERDAHIAAYRAAVDQAISDLRGMRALTDDDILAEMADHCADMLFNAMDGASPDNARARRWKAAAKRYRLMALSLGAYHASLANADAETRRALAYYGSVLLESEDTADGIHALVARLACEAEAWRATAHRLAPPAVADAQHEVEVAK